MSFIQSLFARNARPDRLPADGSAVGRLRRMFDTAGKVVVMTGPGLLAGSNASVPPVDEPTAPVRFRHFLVDEDARLDQWRHSLAQAEASASAIPNAAHAILVKLARTRRLKVVTVNVDGLHAKAGMHPDDHVEIDGHVNGAVCMRCGLRSSIAIHAATVAAGITPTCERDGGMLKPSHSLFGEMPLRSPQMRAEEWAGECDLLIVAGASLTKAPGNGVVNAARQAGAQIAAVGDTGPANGFEADIVVEGDAAGIMAGLAA